MMCESKYWRLQENRRECISTWPSVRPVKQAYTGALKGGGGDLEVITINGSVIKLTRLAMNFQKVLRCTKVGRVTVTSPLNL